MERLTFEGLFCDIAMCQNTPGGTCCETGMCSQRKVWKRLKAYEDTGLTPEEVMEHRFLIAAQKNLGALRRLREVCEADQDGRVVVLPCRVGDTVYISGHRFMAQIDEIVINAMDGITLNWSEYDKGPEETELWDDGWFTPEDFGKTVFLTPEEAEAALKGGAAP